MLHIRPVTDLRYRFAEISKTVHESMEPIFLTKNGRGDMVIMSMEAYGELLISCVKPKNTARGGELPPYEKKKGGAMPDHKPPSGRDLGVFEDIPVLPNVIAAEPSDIEHIPDDQLHNKDSHLAEKIDFVSNRLSQKHEQLDNWITEAPGSKRSRARARNRAKAMPQITGQFPR